MDSGNLKHIALDTSPLSIQGLKSEVHINKLPNELLADIFARLRPDAKWGIASDILQLTHVCTRWRTLALAQPELWTAISVNNLEIAQELSERSGTLPISLSLHAPHSEDLGVGSGPPANDIDAYTAAHPKAIFVLSQLHRVRELRVSLKSREQLYIFLSLLVRRPAPLLDVLFLELQGAVRTDYTEGPLFAGTAPPLRTLTLVHVFSALVRPFELSGLVHLELTLLHATLTRLMETFATNPRLQTITLAIGFIILDDRSQETAAVADLPDLQQLAITVSAHPEGARALLTRLGIPPRANLRVAIRNEILGYHVIPRVATLGCLAGILRVECTLRLQDKTFTLRAFREASPSPSPSPKSESDCAPALEVSFHCVAGADPGPSLESLLRNWPMDVSRVEAYAIAGFRGGRRDVWLELLRPFGALRTLRLAALDGATMAQVAGALGTMDGGEFYALPELRAVRVECVRLPPPGDGSEWLYQALLRRACAAGGKLQEVILEDVAGWDIERAARLAEETSGRLAVRCA